MTFKETIKLLVLPAIMTILVTVAIRMSQPEVVKAADQCPLASCGYGIGTLTADDAGGLGNIIRLRARNDGALMVSTSTQTNTFVVATFTTNIGCTSVAGDLNSQMSGGSPTAWDSLCITATSTTLSYLSDIQVWNAGAAKGSPVITMGGATGTTCMNFNRPYYFSSQTYIVSHNVNWVTICGYNGT